MMNSCINFTHIELKLTVSKTKSVSLGPTARGLTMQTIDNGKESMRNPPTAAFATTKNLHVMTKVKG